MFKTKIIIKTLLLAALPLVLITIDAYALPDFTVTPTDISFSESSPETNQAVTISVTISNDDTDYGAQVNGTPLVDYQTYVTSASLVVAKIAWVAQYFTVSEDCYLGRASALINNAGNTTDYIKVQIRESASGLLKPAEGKTNYLASVEYNHASNTQAWIDFDFDTPVQLTQDTTYWLCFGSSETVSPANYYTVGIASNTTPDMLTLGNQQGDNWSTVQVINGFFTAFHKIYKTTTTTVNVYDGDPDSGGTLLHTESITDHIGSGATKNFSFSWTPTTVGNHTIYASIDRGTEISEFDETNNTAFNSITVSETDPVISSVDPANGSTDISANYAPNIVFSEDMDGATITTSSILLEAIANNLGATISTAISGSVAYDAASKKATFTPATPLSHSYTYRFTVKASVEDLYSHTMGSDRTYTFTTVVSNTISSPDPADGIIGVSVDCTPSIVFSEQLDQSTLTASNVFLEAIKNNLSETVSTTISGTISYNAFSRKATFTPDASLSSNYTYRFTIKASVLDSCGHTMDSDQTFTFTSIMINTESHVVKAADDTTQVNISAGAVAADTFYIEIQTAPQYTDAINQAQSKVSNGTLPFMAKIPDNIRTFNLYTGAYPGQLVENPEFSSPVTITIPYYEAGNGIVANTNPPVHENTLSLYWLNKDNNIWVKFPSSLVDTTNNTVSAEVSHFSAFAILGETNSSLSNAYAYPVPFKPNSDTTHTTITFTGLSSNATIKIYTITGELVKTIIEADGDGMNNSWNASELSSGMYIYRIENDREYKTGQLLIIK